MIYTLFNGDLCNKGGSSISNKNGTKSSISSKCRTIRDHEDDNILGHHERVSLLLPSEAASGGVPATPIVGTPSIETMATFGRRFGQSLPPFVNESKNKILKGHARGSKMFGSMSRCTKRWVMLLSFVWLCTFIANVDSYNPLPDGNGCCDEGNILIVVLF